MSRAIHAFASGVVAAVICYVALFSACKTDLRFCPGPVACQVWK